MGAAILLVALVVLVATVLAKSTVVVCGFAQMMKVGVQKVKAWTQKIALDSQFNVKARPAEFLEARFSF